MQIPDYVIDGSTPEPIPEWLGFSQIPVSLWGPPYFLRAILHGGGKIFLNKESIKFCFPQDWHLETKRLRIRYAEQMLKSFPDFAKNMKDSQLLLLETTLIYKAANFLDCSEKDIRKLIDEGKLGALRHRMKWSVSTHQLWKLQEKKLLGEQL